MHLGASLEGSWDGIRATSPDADAAFAFVRGVLRPGDVVLVKASRAAGLEGLAAALVAGEPTDPGREGMRAILLAGALGLVGTLLGTRWAISFLTRKGYGQLIRDDGPTATTPSAARRPWVAW